MHKFNQNLHVSPSKIKIVNFTKLYSKLDLIYLNVYYSNVGIPDDLVEHNPHHSTREKFALQRFPVLHF